MFNLLLFPLACSALSFTSSTTSGLKKPTKTTDLPTLSLTPIAGIVYDYSIGLNGSDDGFNLRLDIQDALMWIPDDTGFTSCASDYNSQETEISGKVCAYNGVYTIRNDSDSSYYSTNSNSEVDTEEEATHLDIYLPNYIDVQGVFVKDSFDFNLTDSEGSTYLQELDNVVIVATNSSSYLTGGLGVGLSLDDNRNFITNFVEEGLIQANSYSLSLSSNGLNELILGGINTDKYVDDLTLFDFIPMVDPSYDLVPEAYNGYADIFPILPISRFGVTSNSTGASALFSEEYNDKLVNSSYPKPAILDSRTYFNYIPYSTLIELALELNAYYSSEYERWIVDCAVKDTGTVDIYFGNLTINMNIAELIQPQQSDNGTQMLFENGQLVCTLLFLPDYYWGHSLLGTPFLRNIYLAIDNEAKQMAIAQSSRQTLQQEKKSNKTNLYPIESGYIPFALPNNFTSYDDLVMTVSSSLYSINVTEGGSVLVSNGEFWTDENGLTNTLSQSSNTASASVYSSKNGTNGLNNASSFACLFGLVLGLLSLL